MAIVNVSRWKGNLTQATPIAREAGAIVKQHGAVSMRMGTCYSGPHAGQLYIAIAFADWETFGKAQQVLAADENFQRLYAEALKLVELEERSLLVTEDL
jgi:putative AlgH/UPF0301 family transcriptional regulator